MDLNIELNIQNQVTLSYLEVADNFSFTCKSNDHKTAKLHFILTFSLREKSSLLHNIFVHLKSAHNVNIEDITSRLDFKQIREQYPVVS